MSTSLEPTVAALGKVAPRLAEMEATMTRNVRESVGGLAKRIEAGHAATTQSYSEVGAKTAELQALLETLIEELKKPKKGWFS